MIYGNVEQKETWQFLEEKLTACFAYVKNHDMLHMQPGTYEINGRHFYVNVSEYTTTVRSERFWEAHRKYLDVHVMLQGIETIDLGFVWRMNPGEYEPDKDFLPLDGQATATVTMREGDFLICMPQDAHMTAIMNEQPQKIKKAIFKVQI
ncbi:YhcH/YjgK/YiaL family protein [Marvinbryantia formatexigens]|nr:YhcH/YjgK/YiaL family protein [Marvinbryantia formatexigens]UWO23037.1 YhcH/YjgK/YiaL family protein [Marvinbryantia formatexigens DSM 14469]SDF96747.1 YhcH/YjgK/YiaL family protein [Marvinbryantia formatexigens]